MSKKLICVVRDAVAQAYLPPFHARSEGEARRSFSNEVNNPDSPFNRHSADFILYHIGSFDELTGEIQTIAPVNLGSGDSYRIAEAQ